MRTYCTFLSVLFSGHVQKSRIPCIHASTHPDTFFNPSKVHKHSQQPPNSLSSALPHSLQEIRLLDSGPALIPQRLCQLLARILCGNCAGQTAVAGGQVDCLFVDGDLGDQHFRVHCLFLAQPFCGETALFFGFGKQISRAPNIPLTLLPRQNRPQPGRILLIRQRHGILRVLQKVQPLERLAGRYTALHKGPCRRFLLGCCRAFGSLRFQLGGGGGSEGCAEGLCG